MHYLLTSEELAALAPRAELEIWKKTAMQLAQRLAQTRVTMQGGIEPVSGCVLLPSPVSQYCNGCPAYDLCPVMMKILDPNNSP